MHVFGIGQSVQKMAKLHFDFKTVKDADLRGSSSKKKRPTPLSDEESWRGGQRR